MIALIPARAGSKRLPNKNTKPLGGKPLLRWTIEAALESGCFDEVYVCSDDFAVLALAESPVRCWQRDPVSDDQRDIEWVSHFLRDHPGHSEYAILRPTSPFRDAGCIRRAKDQWDACKDRLDSLRAMRTSTEHPYKAWVVEDEWNYQDQVSRLVPELGAKRGHTNYKTMVPITTAAAKKHLHSMPTQSLTDAYIQTAGLEMAWTRTALEKGTLAGDQVGMFLVEGPEALDINSPEDFAHAEYLVAQGLVPGTK